MRVAVLAKRGMVAQTFLDLDLSCYEIDLFGRDTSFSELLDYPVIINFAPSDVSLKLYSYLEDKHFQGFYLDASSAWRLDERSFLPLGPLNEKSQIKYIQKGGRLFSGANCTVSLLLFALWPLLKENVIEYISTHTYQALSGMGKEAILELIAENHERFSKDAELNELLKSETPHWPSLMRALEREQSPQSSFPASGVLPLIGDLDKSSGASMEELKGTKESLKILTQEGLYPVALEGLCVRVKSLRCHAQSATIKLTKALTLDEIHTLYQGASHTFLIEDEEEKIRSQLCPQALSETDRIHVGRIRHAFGRSDMIHLFSLGDQLMWGAALPLWHTLNLIYHTQKETLE